MDGIQETLFQIALLGFSSGMIIAAWFGFIGTAVKYIIDLANTMGG